jgi:hypothetical protein
MAEADFEQKAKDYEAGEAATKAALAKVFDVKALVARTAQIKEVYHPVLGKMRYGELTLEDSFEINKCANAKEKLLTSAWLMLKKADPAITVDDIRKLPLAEGAALSAFAAGDTSFLSQKDTSQSHTLKPGSKTRQKRKT